MEEDNGSPPKGFTAVQLAIAKQRLEDELTDIRKEKDKEWRLEVEGLRVLEGREILDVKKEWRRKEERQKLDAEGLFVIEDPTALGSDEEPSQDNDIVLEDPVVASGPTAAASNLLEQVTNPSVAENAACEIARVPRFRRSRKRKPTLLQPGQTLVDEPPRRECRFPPAFRIYAPYGNHRDSDSESDSESEEEGEEEGEEVASGSVEEEKET